MNDGDYKVPGQSDGSEPPKKKKKLGKGARLIGKLANLMLCPMEVFIEVRAMIQLSPTHTQSLTLDSFSPPHEQILFYLEPLNLLQLARASKIFRSILFSRSSKHLWVVARRNVLYLSPPECPSDLSEPAYASLLFDTHCMVSRIVSMRHMYM